MSIFAAALRGVYRLSGAKKAFALPEDEIRKIIEKQDRHRGVFTPTEALLAARPGRRGSLPRGRPIHCTSGTTGTPTARAASSSSNERMMSASPLSMMGE